MMRLSFQRHRVATFATLTVTIGSVIAAGAAMYSNHAPSESLAAFDTESMDAVWNGSLLARSLAAAGITPESLAASGVAANQVGDVVSRARASLVESGAALQTKLADVRLAKAAYQGLERRVHTGVSTEQERSAFSTAATTLSTAEGAKNTAIEALFQAATAGLNADRVTSLRNFAANRRWEVPMKYRAVQSRTDVQWVTLRDAVSHVRAASQAGEEPDPVQAEIVTNADAETPVSAAAAGLNNLAAITTAWNAAVE